MHDKVLLKMLLPASGQTYEFRVPLSMEVGQGARLMSRVLESKERMRYKALGDVELMYLEGEQAGGLLDPHETFLGLVRSDRVVNGSRLALL